MLIAAVGLFSYDAFNSPGRFRADLSLGSKEQTQVEDLEIIENMDLLEDSEFLGLNSSKHLPIFSKSLNLPPHMVMDSGVIKSSVIADGSIIAGSVIHSTVAYQVSIGFSSVIRNCVVLPNAVIGNNVEIENAIINAGLNIPTNYYSKSKKIRLITAENLLEVGEIR